MYTLRPVKRNLPSFKSAFEAARSGAKLTHDQLVRLVSTTNKSEMDCLHDAAGELNKKIYNNKIFTRGIIEFSNACEKRCHYCGVTAYDDKFLISHDAILECTDYMYEIGYRNLVLQSGEITSEPRIRYLEELLHKIQQRYGTEPNKGMCVVLSVGELSRQQYQRLFDAGSQRYLLRIESSNPELYKSMHPPDHLFSRRIQALNDLKSIGYVTGTGVMVGVPNQTYDDLAGDIEFFRDGRFPMIGLGPYIIHKDTVMGRQLLKTTTEKERKNADILKVKITLNIYNVLRLQCPMINIAATTALETLSPGSKAIALSGGCNVLMPIITPKIYRGGYQLYEGKKEVDMDREKTHQSMLELLKSIGKIPSFGEWNHPKLYLQDHPHAFGL